MSPRTVHWCIQCDERLPARCTKCLKHPDRKPRIVELYERPYFLKHAECGCCVLIACQRPGCLKTRWTHLRANGELPSYQNHFCGPECVRLVTADARKAQRVTTPCACGCGQKITRPASNMRAKNVYYSQKHHFAHRVALKAAARRATAMAADALDDGSLQFVFCQKCDDVTDHERQPDKKLKCVRCHNKRPESLGVLAPMERVMAKRRA